jgi:L-threonylcarbamoyladenylate synthase
MDKKKIVFWSDAFLQDDLLTFLLNNHVLIVGTDTVYGFLGAPTSFALKELQRVKGVVGQKPLILLVGSIEKLSHFVEIHRFSLALHTMLEVAWPGPVTVIFKAKPTVPTSLISNNGTIAIRIPQHQGLLKLLQSFDGLYSTSANSTGKPTPQRCEDIEFELIEQVSMVVKNDKEFGPAVASTIIDCSAIQESGEGTIKVIRAGAYPISELEALYGEAFE